MLRIGVAAGLAAAACDLVVLLLAAWQGWDLTVPGAPAVGPLGVVLVCVVVGVLAALGAYAAARVTKRPEIWVLTAGVGLWLASVQGLPRTLQVVHLIAAVWIVGWLARAVVRGSHVR
ncbi:MAG: hypothetical protein IPG68_04065 [Micrococcales bacterium]|nr:hypothetical protein [Micrococcales bacterium]